MNAVEAVEVLGTINQDGFVFEGVTYPQGAFICCEVNSDKQNPGEYIRHIRRIPFNGSMLFNCPPWKAKIYEVGDWGGLKFREKK